MSPTPAPEVIWRVVDDQVLFLHTTTGDYLSLNDSGAFVWQMLAEGLPVSDIGRNLAKRYGISLDTALADVNDLIEELKAASILSDD